LYSALLANRDSIPIDSYPEFRASIAKKIRKNEQRAALWGTRRLSPSGWGTCEQKSRKLLIPDILTTGGGWGGGYQLNNPAADMLNLARAAAAPRCNFYLADGRRCGSPALRGGRLCRIHVRKFVEAYARRRRQAVPDLAAARTIAVGITQVIRYLWEEEPSVSQCGKILNGIQQASANLRKKQVFVPAIKDP
jgi:hypothetical protein